MKKRLAVPLTALLAWSGSVSAQQPAAPAKPYKPDNKPVAVAVPGRASPATEGGRANVRVAPAQQSATPVPPVTSGTAAVRVAATQNPIPPSPPAAAPMTPLRPAVPNDAPKPLPQDVAQPDAQPDAGKSTRPSAPRSQAQSTPAANAQSNCPSCDTQDSELQKKLRLMDVHCGPPEQFWAKTGYLFWQFKDMTLPFPLVTTGNLVPIGPPNFFAIDNPRTIAGADDVSAGTFNGMNINAGMWFDSRHTIGLEFGGFILESRSEINGINSDGSIAVARPIIDALATPAQPVDVLVAAPGLYRGGVAVSVESQLAGAEVNIARNLSYCEDYTWDVIAGFRYLDLDESLTISHYSQRLSPAADLFVGGAAVNDLFVQDRFRARNQFYGGQVGTRFEARRGIWFGGFSGKLGLGPNHQVVEITGSTTGTTDDGTRFVQNGGLLALTGIGRDVNNNPVPNSGNIGRRSTNWFVVVPEVGLTLGCQVTQNIRTTVGYNFLYVNSVTRPGDAVSQTVNQKFVPSSTAFGSVSGADRPVPQFQRSDFFAHGVELGLQLQF